MNSKIHLKFILALSLIGLLGSCFGTNSEIVAKDYYSYECGSDFEVSKITDDGQFSSHACYHDFNRAQEEMYRMGSEYVVRHHKSHSPSKIVAMVSGKAYSYPARNGAAGGATINVYQDLDLNNIEYKRTYVSNHYELDYYRTERYYENSGVGMVKVSLNGFDGYADLEYVDLVPDKFIDKGLVIYLGGGDVTAQNEQPFKVIVRRNYYKVVENNGINELMFVFHRSYAKPSNNNKFDEEHSIILGPASTEMTPGAVYYSPNGYEFYNKYDYSDEKITFYPYYQFLPVRSKTNLTSEQIDDAFIKINGDIDSKIKGNANIFIDAQNTYGINALLLYSMAAHESAWGKSNYAMNRNNLFGWKAVDADPDQATKFDSVSQCVYEQAGYNLRKYTDIFSPLYFSSSLGNKGSGFNVQYASDPYWGMKISSIAYQIDKTANGGKPIDYDQYDLALVSKLNADFKREPNKDSETLFTAQYSKEYQENLIVIKLADDGKFTKVQSTNPIVDGVVKKTYKVDPELVPYNFDESIVYLNNEDIASINYEPIEIPEPMGEYIHNLKTFDWDEENNLTIAGQAYTDNVAINEENTITNKLVIYNEQTQKEFPLISTVNEDGTVDFAGAITFNELTEGEYRFKVVTTYSNREEANNEFTIADYVLPSIKVVDGFKYTFGINDGAIVLNISVIEEVAERKYMIVDSSEIDENNIWKISGRAFLSGHNYEAIENVKHEFVVVDQLTDEIVKEYALETLETPSFSLNDDYNYQFVGFRGDIPLVDFANGHYRFQVRLILSEDETETVSLINLESSNLKYASNIVDIVSSEEQIQTYKLTTNQMFTNRFELDVENKAFDYQLINKPSVRDSFVSFNKLVTDEKNLIINGYGFIYYTSYGVQNNPIYKVSLMSEMGELIDLKAVQPEKQRDFSKIFSKTRDLSRISFEVNFDLSEIQNGIYDLIVEISSTEENNDYYDIVQIKDYQNNEYAPIILGNKNIQLVVSKDRNRVQLVVSDLVKE